ncbi:hypothetical protein WMF23_01935 [Sorangium sp. So ce542]
MTSTPAAIGRSGVAMDWSVSSRTRNICSWSVRFCCSARTRSVMSAEMPQTPVALPSSSRSANFVVRYTRTPSGRSSWSSRVIGALATSASRSRASNRSAVSLGTRSCVRSPRTPPLGLPSAASSWRFATV